MKKVGILLLLVGALLSALSLPFTNFGQPTRPPDLNRILFMPTKYPAGDWEPSDLIYQDVYFHSADHNMLHGWYCPSIGTKISILIIHGNAGNIATRTSLLRHFQSVGTANVFLFDYRGYGRSEGIPTVEGVLLDAQAAIEELGELSNSQASEIVIMGESIGGAIALELALAESPRGLVLQSTFSNLKDLAGVHYPQYVSTVPGDVLNSTNMIQKYHGPLLQSHGEKDRIIPIALGRRLFEMAAGEKQFLAIPDAGHNDWQTSEYYLQLDRFIQQLVSTSLK